MKAVPVLLLICNTLKLTRKALPQMGCTRIVKQQSAILLHCSHKSYSLYTITLNTAFTM